MSSAEAILRKNLEKGERARAVADIVTASQLEEAALYLKKEGDFSPETLKTFFEKSFSLPLVSGELLRLCTLLSEDKKEIARKAKKRATVALIMSPLSRLALEKLGPEYPALQPLSFSDFRSLCEAVSSEKCDYCLLPYCSSCDGYYPTFSKLQKSYDLKICSSVRVTRPDSDEEVQLCLLSRELEENEKKKLLSFSFVEGDGSSPSEVIRALCDGGCHILSINSSPLEYNMDRSEYRIEVLCKGTAPRALADFLSVSLPGHTVLGIY